MVNAKEKLKPGKSTIRFEFAYDGGGVDYYKCGVNYYRAAFQGNNLVYVTTKPE